jgi:hypothetical protein
VTVLASQQKRCLTILRYHIATHTTVRNYNTATRSIITATDIVPLWSRVAAGLRHKPPRNIDVTFVARQQKRYVAILRHHIATHTTVKTNNNTATRTITSATDIVSLRSPIAAGLRHKPPRNIDVTVPARQQKRWVAILRHHNNA